MRIVASRFRLPLISVSPLALASLLAFSACGGGGDEPLLFDPANADELAHAALPALNEFPGTGWTLVATDRFDEGDDELPVDTPACRDMTRISDEMEEKTEAARAGRAKIEIARRGTNNIDTEVEVSVNIFEDTDSPDEALDEISEYFESRALRDCFNDLLDQALAELPDLDIESELVGPIPDLPDGVEGTAFLVTVSADGLEIGFRAELYAWRHGNAGVSVEMVGAEEDVIPQRVMTMLLTVRQHVEAAAAAE